MQHNIHDFWLIFVVVLSFRYHVYSFGKQLVHSIPNPTSKVETVLANSVLASNGAVALKPASTSLVLIHLSHSRWQYSDLKRTGRSIAPAILYHIWSWIYLFWDLLEAAQFWLQNVYVDNSTREAIRRPLKVGHAYTVLKCIRIAHFHCAFGIAWNDPQQFTLSELQCY